MSRPGISYDSVEAAALELLGKGLNPSIQRVREILGTGSNSTIGEHLKRWQQELSNFPKVVLPPMVPEAVISALEQFWRVAAEQAEMAYHDLREKAAAAVTAAERGRDEAIAKQQRLDKQIATLKQQLTGVETKAKELEKHLVVEQERRTIAEEVIESAEQRATQATQLTEQLRLEAESHIRRLEDGLHKFREDTERQLTEAEQRLHYERQRGEANEDRLIQIIEQTRLDHTRECQRFDEERKLWKAQEASLQKELEALQNALATTQLAKATVEERAEQMTANFTHTSTVLQELQGRHLNAVRLVEALRGKLKATTTKHRALEKEFQQLQAELAAYASADQKMVDTVQDTPGDNSPKSN